jgi:flagellin-like hook-associated protein FlgL
MFSISISAETIDFSKVDYVVESYNSNKIDIAQFIVYVNSFLKIELENFGDDFLGFTEDHKKEIINDYRKNNPVKEDSEEINYEMIVIPTKDFDLLFNFYKGNNKLYSLIFGIAPSSKEINKKIKDAEEEFANKIISEEQSKIDISEENIDLKNLQDQKDNLLETINDLNEQEDTKELYSQINELDDQISQIKNQIDDKQKILDGEVNVDFSSFDVYEVICEARYDESINIRLLFEKALPNFPRWYFNEFKKGVDNYFKLASGHEYVLNQVSENRKEIKELESCAKQERNIKSINIKYNEGSELFNIWEKNGEVLYQFYFMPSKEMMKEIIETKIIDPTAVDSQTSESADKKDKIVKLAERYGGSFDAVIRIVDDERNILFKQLTINPEIIISSKDVFEDNDDADVVITLKYDKLYEYMEFISKDVQGTNEKNADFSKSKSSSNTKHVVGILSKGFNMWVSGVKINPITEVPKLLFNLKLITDIFGD